MRINPLVENYPIRIREVTFGSILLLLLIFYFFPRFKSNAVVNKYDIVKQIETFDIPQTQQIKIPDPPARPSVPIASDDEFFDEDITIEDTESDNFDWETPPPPKRGPKIKFVPYDKKPEPKFPISPNYPEIAKEAGIEGKVYIEAGIDAKGNVISATVVKGIPNTGLDEAALEAVLRSKWKPARQRDKKVAVKIIIPIKFELN